MHITLNFRREGIVFVITFFLSKMLLEPYAKFPNSSSVTAKHAQTRGIGRGKLKGRMTPFTQGIGYLLSTHIAEGKTP